MSLESVRAFFAEKAPDIAVIESPMSSATVVLAAEAYGVEPARIGKTLSLRIGERVVLIVTSGTSRMDNKKVKAQFGGKPKMLGLEEVAEITGHEVGGVCPFGLKTPLPVYCDVSLKAFDEEIERLRALISQMGGLAEHSIEEAMRCLIQRDLEGAEHLTVAHLAEAIQYRTLDRSYWA